MADHNFELYPALERYVACLSNEFAHIEPARRGKLEALARLLAEGRVPPSLVFICTHNSRRSQLCQLWATVASARTATALNSYSGGTEVTALNPRAVAALKRAGFEICDGGGGNPVYEVRYSGSEKPERCFSKLYDSDTNPEKDFIAVMTCSEADAACPLVTGARARFALPYLDPKASDDSPDETQIYDDRCRQIAVEMFYLFQSLSEMRSGD